MPITMQKPESFYQTGRGGKTICFISETRRESAPYLDPSTRYRCYHAAEMLSQKGNFCAVYSSTQFHQDPCMDFDVYIYHRPSSARQDFNLILNQLKINGKTLIADYDDLVFGNKEIALQSSAVRNKTLSESDAIKVFSNNLTALQEFSIVTTSTRELSRRAQSANPNAKTATWANFIPPSITDLHEATRTYLKPRSPNSIGYFGGTRSHDKDFQSIEDVLYRVLLENPDYTFTLVGPVAVSKSFTALPNMNAMDVVDYEQLPTLMSRCATVIAPLELSPFNHCKSRVKFLEASLSGSRLLATGIPDMVDAGNGHIIFPATPDDWYNELSAPQQEGDRLNSASKIFDLLKSNMSIANLEEIGGLN